jgi:hypothetical protein
MPSGGHCWPWKAPEEKLEHLEESLHSTEGLRFGAEAGTLLAWGHEVYFSKVIALSRAHENSGQKSPSSSCCGLPMPETRILSVSFTIPQPGPLAWDHWAEQG